MIASDFNANWASPPGETIKRVLTANKMDINELSSKIDLSEQDFTGLLSGVKRIDENLAEKIEQYIGGSASFWLNRDKRYVSQIERINNETIENEEWVKLLPIKDMIKFGWLQDTGDLVESCFEYFSVNSRTDWESKYEEILGSSMFRTSTTFNEDIGAAVAWLRQGEIIANKIECDKWNPLKLEESIPEFRKLTRIKSPNVFIPKLVDLCASVGVALSIVRAPTGCRTSGVTRFISEDKAIVQLSLRYMADDQFWFTFFHEIGHLIMHTRDKIYIEPTAKRDYVNSEEEVEANLFAQASLIPIEYEGVLKNMRRDKRTIVRIASELGISPGILIGQMQHRGIIKFSYLNGYKRHYKWEEIKKSLRG